MQNIHSIFNLKSDKLFSEDEAYELINLFMAITSKAKNKINGLNSRLEYHQHDPQKADDIQNELNREITKWSEKIRRLGGTPLALYQVKIPAQEGAFFWNYPESTIDFEGC